MEVLVMAELVVLLVCVVLYLFSILDEDVWEALLFIGAASAYMYFLGTVFFENKVIAEIVFLLLIVVISLRYLHHKRILLEKNLEQFLKYAREERDRLASELVLNLKVATKNEVFDVVKLCIRKKDYKEVVRHLSSFLVDGKVDLQEVSALISLCNIDLDISPSKIKKDNFIVEIIVIFDFCRKKIQSLY